MLSRVVSCLKTPQFTHKNYYLLPWYSHLRDIRQTLGVWTGSGELIEWRHVPLSVSRTIIHGSETKSQSLLTQQHWSLWQTMLLLLVPLLTMTLVCLFAWWMPTLDWLNVWRLCSAVPFLLSIKRPLCVVRWLLHMQMPALLCCYVRNADFVSDSNNSSVVIRDRFWNTLYKYNEYSSDNKWNA